MNRPSLTLEDPDGKVTSLIVENRGISEFISGRQFQFIDDFYPVVPIWRKKIGVTLPEMGRLSSSSDVLKRNFNLTYITLRYPPDTRKLPTKSLNNLTKHECFNLGKSWQFLLDCGRGRWTTKLLNVLSFTQIMDMADKLHTKLKEPVPECVLSAIMSKVLMQNCEDKNCKESFFDGRNIHCVPCRGELTLDMLANNPYPYERYKTTITRIDCEDGTCRLLTNYHYCGICFPN